MSSNGFTTNKPQGEKRYVNIWYQLGSAYFSLSAVTILMHSTFCNSKILCRFLHLLTEKIGFLYRDQKYPCFPYGPHGVGMTDLGILPEGTYVVEAAAVNDFGQGGNPGEIGTSWTR